MDNSRNRWWQNASLKIFASHAFSSWGDRMWSFAVGFYLVILFDSLQLTAIYGFLDCISAILFGASIGKWVDKSERLKSAQMSLTVQNSSVVICAGLLLVHLYFQEEMETLWNGALGILVIGFVILFAMLGNLASIATKIVLEKDWVVVLASGNETSLSRMNATMRTIDLTTAILAPILVGQIFTYGSHIIGALFIAGWNIVSWGLEYILLKLIYKSIPELSLKKKLSEVSVEVNTPANGTNALDDGVERKPPLEFFQRNVAQFGLRFKEAKIGWRDYFSHPIRNAGLGLACLYMTVLGFDSITTGYAYSQGVSESILGIANGLGAIFGILGSVLFPFLRNKLGKLVTGNIGFGTETICLALCLVSIVTPGSPFVYRSSVSVGDADLSCPNLTRGTEGAEDAQNYTFPELWNCNISVLLLLFGIVSARFGLWVADLSVSQIFQERIGEDQRGVLNGVQGALNQTMNLLKFLIVIILPNSETFAYLIAASWLFIFFGWIFFMVYSWTNRNEPKQVNASSLYKDNILTISSAVQENNTKGIGNNESSHL